MDICPMNMYKIVVKDNAVALTTIANLEAGDIGINTGDKTIQWLALECEDDQTAIKIAGAVINSVWKRGLGVIRYLYINKRSLEVRL